MAKIPINLHTTKNMIENAPDIAEDINRGYLGMSGIGGDCVRALWLGFRFAITKKVIPVQLHRIFERGNMEEARIIKDLKKIGVEVFRRDNQGSKIEIFGHKGEEQEEFTAAHGHAKGHSDGRVLGLPEAPKSEHGLEIKTMNDANWNSFSKKGVEVSHPKYYSQVQRYMKAMGLDRFMFIATNKNNEKREYERIHYNKDHAEMLFEREYEIITSDRPVGEKFPRTWFACKMCNKYDICHNDRAPDITCRSCEHSDMGTEGVWMCSLQNDKELSLHDQLIACSSYRRLF
jgi:hypothetical protein